ncbi:MAG: hypothetical protein JO279_10610 [Verrucomicrobia bacterium]|nr:hypothetical protein [Verrucomicrobiota bacterium]MBV8377439.1 hypothetical protein [Verrucomicrobiota bacterium]
MPIGHKDFLFLDRRRPWISGAEFRCVLLFSVLLTSLYPLAAAETEAGHHRTKQPSVLEKPAVASELAHVVAAFITAGEQNDPAVRGKYLGSKVFYYGHARTHNQAVKAIAALYRRWPQRQFALTESLDLFEIPNHRGIYRATAVYDYKFENGDEHLSGKSKMTCVVEHDGLGTRIIGVDEKLLNGSTDYHSE